MTLSVQSQVSLHSEWNFNNFGTSTLTNGFGETIAADSGSGELFAQSATSTGTNFSRNTSGGTTTGAWDSAEAGGSIDLRRGERWNDSYIELRLDMTNSTDLGLSFAGNISSTFPTTTTLQWSNDGGANFTNFDTLTFADDSPSNVYSLFAYDSVGYGLSALDNQSDVVIRFQFSGGGAAASTGSGFVLDNIVVTAVPEPGTYAAILGALALVGVWLRRRQ
jgi:hypothetical protein